MNTEAASYFADKAQALRRLNPMFVMLTMPTPCPDSTGPHAQLEPPVYGDSDEA